MTLKDMREKRGRLVAEARSIVETFTGRGEALDAEGKQRVDALRAEAQLLKDTIERADELEAEDRAFVPESQRTSGAPARGQEPSAEDRNAAVVECLRGFATNEQRAIANRARTDVPAEMRAQGVTGNVGGYTIAPDTRFYGMIIEAMKAYGGMLSAPIDIITTDTGADLPIPTDNDTSNTGEVVAEAGSLANGTDVTLGQITLHAYVVAAKTVKVSLELIQDSAANFEKFLAKKLGQRIARKLNALLTVGTGSSQHQGIAYSGASVGRTCATGFVTTCTADDLLRLKHSVDPEYRNRPGAGFMFNDTTLLTLAMLKDGEGQYLLKGLQDDSAARLHGKPFYINTDMVDMAASAKSVAFGDYSSYVHRKVQGIQIIRLNELFAENRQVGFLGWERSDGVLVDAGMHPIRVLVNAAS